MDKILELLEEKKISKITIDQGVGVNGGVKVDCLIQLEEGGTYESFTKTGSYIESTLDKVIEEIDGRENARTSK